MEHSERGLREPGGGTASHRTGDKNYRSAAAAKYFDGCGRNFEGTAPATPPKIEFNSITITSKHSRTGGPVGRPQPTGGWFRRGGRKATAMIAQGLSAATANAQGGRPTISTGAKISPANEGKQSNRRQCTGRGVGHHTSSSDNGTTTRRAPTITPLTGNERTGTQTRRSTAATTTADGAAVRCGGRNEWNTGQLCHPARMGSTIPTGMGAVLGTAKPSSGNATTSSWSPLCHTFTNVKRSYKEDVN
mmetsp:Transcript_22150/g.46747  ORF Transcript_22150/g.46747 Transcript_22150/m.46747 type:complete len:247 (-) Transcript_22150:21-761(-)